MRDPRAGIEAAVAALKAQGLEADRCEILQNGSTLVLRLREDLVSRVVHDAGDGARSGVEWFARENTLAAHLMAAGAPVIALHPAMPMTPVVHAGLPMSFWCFVQRMPGEVDVHEAARLLARCLRLAQGVSLDLPVLAVPREAIGVLAQVARRGLMSAEDLALLREVIVHGLQELEGAPQQVLHGDAHLGNAMLTTQGLLWTDWEDAFLGPLEWDLASLICNARLLDGDETAVEAMSKGWAQELGPWDEQRLRVCLRLRVAVICAWYPLLYPAADGGRQAKLRQRLQWLRESSP